MKDKEKLIKVLEKTIADNKENTKAKLMASKKVAEKGITLGDFMKIWMLIDPLSELDDVSLFIYAKALYETMLSTNASELDPELRLEKYFTEVEIREGTKYQYEYQSQKIDFPMKINNVLQVAYDQWVTVMSLQEIKRLWYGIPVIYNFETQRDAKHKVLNGNIVNIKNTNSEAVKIITERILKGEQKPNTLTFNILQDGNDDVVYNARHNQLIIHKGQVNILDGDHRSMGILAALSINPNLQMNYEVRFTNFDTSIAQDFINQEQTVNKFKKEYRRTLNTNQSSTRIVSRIKASKSDLANCITSDKSLIRQNMKLVLFSTIADAIDYNYKLSDNKNTTNKQLNDIADWVSEFMDEVIGLYPEVFIANIESNKSKNIMNHNNTFIGYIALSRILQNNNNWKNKLKSILSSINFSIDNSIWKEINIFNNKLKKSYYEKISEYFIGEVK